MEKIKVLAKFEGIEERKFDGKVVTVINVVVNHKIIDIWDNLNTYQVILAENNIKENDKFTLVYEFYINSKNKPAVKLVNIEV